jgi:hypothetical protein
MIFLQTVRVSFAGISQLRMQIVQGLGCSGRSRAPPFKIPDPAEKFRLGEVRAFSPSLGLANVRLFSSMKTEGLMTFLAPHLSPPPLFPSAVRAD